MIHVSVIFELVEQPTMSLSSSSKIADPRRQQSLLEFFIEKKIPVGMALSWFQTEQWLQNQEHDLLATIEKAIDLPTIETLDSAAYHAILPLLPEAEILRQVELNRQRHQKVFANWKPEGFFPPELAFGHELPALFAELGYSWCLADDLTYTCIHDIPPYKEVPKCLGLPIIMRSSHWSNQLHHAALGGVQGQPFAERLVRDVGQWFGQDDGYLIIALQSGIFGSSKEGALEDFLKPLMESLQENKEVKLTSVGDLLETFTIEEREVPPGSWSTTVDNFWEGDFFPLWQGRYNSVHRLLWELTDLAVTSVKRLQDRLDRSLNSDIFWAATMQGRGRPDAVDDGLKMLLDVVASASPDQMDRALRLIENIDEVFDNFQE